jgi:AraC-like DNA-binding protein
VLLSRNYPPSADLAPFIRRHYIFSADLPADFEIADRLLSETAFVRILIKGDWAAETAPGEWTTAGPTVLFGANAHPLPVRVRGSFTVAGFGIKPGGWEALFARSAHELTDGMVPLSQEWGGIADTMYAEVANAESDEAIVAAMERALHAQLDAIGKPHEDMLITRYEAIARLDSTAKVEDVAASLGLSVRQIERRCLKAFGMSPKSVFRRSRFLDMAMAMRGLSSVSEAQLATLRYFDQSHLNREFRTFVGMTPGQFRKSETPLLTAGLKLRSEGDFLFNL